VNGTKRKSRKAFSLSLATDIRFDEAKRKENKSKQRNKP